MRRREQWRINRFTWTIFHTVCRLACFVPRAKARPWNRSSLGADHDGVAYPFRIRRYPVGAISITALKTRVK
jgi:hypothetical protein